MGSTVTSNRAGSVTQRLSVTIQGLVQGVGFRPFVYTLAQELGLVGWVKNSPQGVALELEGSRDRLLVFLDRLEQDRPPHAQLNTVQTTWADPLGYDRFEIRASDPPNRSQLSALILPDLATCPACLRDLFDPTQRRYHYPFTNCTHCGPRFSILRSLPYDRPHTTMRAFQMCPDCQAEYDDPLNRRFHAQPNACPRCGPHLELWDATGQVLTSDQTHPGTALPAAAEALRRGQILAVKGLGGFHLMVDARRQEAVQTLRQRKHRPDKPLAIMAPSLAWVEQNCQVSDLERSLLTAAEAPIVLLARRCDGPEAVAAAVAPDNPYLGVMLPYTPLHHGLMADLNSPLVATSGNQAGEPICIDEQEALQRLGAIADQLLVHNRPIARPVDDSIVQVVQQQPILLRRARGYAPLSLPLPRPDDLFPSATAPIPLLAVGAHLKTTIALALPGQMVLSQHLGDLDTPQTLDRFQEAIHQLLTMYQVAPRAIACDAHPDYISTQFAQAYGQADPQADRRMERTPSIHAVQHHYAHVLSGMVDNDLTPPVLGIAWDGTGYGLDGTLWGGEFLVVPGEDAPPHGFERVAHLRPFPLPGGDRAAREPRRSAAGLLYAILGEAWVEQVDLAPLQSFTSQERRLLATMLRQGINTPHTSSMGRWLDAIAALLNLRQHISFEGQAAMQLEFAIQGLATQEQYPYGCLESRDAPLQVDWEPMVRAVIADWRDRCPSALIAARVHNTLVDMIVAIAQRVGIGPVVLTGGCFQNRYLLDQAVRRLKIAGFAPAMHRRIPTHDGGIAVGQLVGALRLSH